MTNDDVIVFFVVVVGFFFFFDILLFSSNKKIDICPANVLDETLQTLTKMLKAPGSNKMPMMVSTMVGRQKRILRREENKNKNNRSKKQEEEVSPLIVPRNYQEKLVDLILTGFP